METEIETKRKPRGQIRRWFRADRPNRPWYLSYIVDGRKIPESFPTERERDERYRFLEKSRKSNTLALEPSRREIEEYRAFKKVIGDTDWRDVVAAWQKTGSPQSMNVEEMAAAYKKWQIGRVAAGKLKEAGMRRNTKLTDAFAADHHGKKANSLTKDGIIDWIEEYHEDCEDEVPAAETFNHTIGILSTMWSSSREPNNICANDEFNPDCVQRRSKIDGIEKIRVLPLGHVEKLLAYGLQCMEWIMPRIALECFVGVRFVTAANITKNHINTQDRGVDITGDILKTKKRRYVDGLEGNLWEWIALASDDTWRMTERQYLRFKSSLFEASEVPHPHNCFRHSACSYHAAAFQNPGKTATMLCHRNQDLLWERYKGKATQADGLLYYKITPDSLRKKLEAGLIMLPDSSKSAPQSPPLG